MDVVYDALVNKAGSTIVARKTKNSSNKNKERMSIVGAIANLIGQQNWPPSSSGAAGEVTTITFMC